MVVFLLTILPSFFRRHSNTQINGLSNELLIIVLRNLSVIDRLQCERVSPHWNEVLKKWGWNRQEKLDKEIIFGGTTKQQIARFNQDSMVSIFRRLADSLTVLDLKSFDATQLDPFIPDIARSLHLLPKLLELNIGELNHFVEFLPGSLHTFRSEGPFTEETLDAISIRCPNLTSIHLRGDMDNLSVPLSKLNAFIAKYPRLLELYMSNVPISRANANASLTAIGQLKELEDFTVIINNALDEEAFKAIYEGCHRLRSLTYLNQNQMQAALYGLAEMPSLRSLDVGEYFTDPLLMEVARRGKLKRFGAFYNEQLTDASVEYLIEKCKSPLLYLVFAHCPRITERSVEAAVAEVKRRNDGTPLDDKGPPYQVDFYIVNTGINMDRAKEIIDEISWVQVRMINS